MMSTGQLFCRLFLILGFSDVFLMIRGYVCLQENHRSDLFSVHHIRGYVVLICLTASVILTLITSLRWPLLDSPL